MIELGIFVVVVCVLLYILHRPPKGFPPGPWGIPIFGYLPFLQRETYKAFISLGKKYKTNIIGLRLGRKNLVILNDYQSIKDVLKMDALLGKPADMMFSVDWASHGTDHIHGIMLSEGQEWHEQHRFTLRHLRDFGFAKKGMEESLTMELEELIDGFRKEVPGPFEMSKRFNIVVINALFKMCIGERYRHDDPTILEMAGAMDGPFSSATYPGVMFYMPELINFFPKYFGFGWNEFAKSVKETTGYMRGKIDEHEKTFQPDTMRDFVDVYLREIKNTTDPSSTFYGEHGKRSLTTVLMDLFAAGTHTTSTGMTWALLYLAAHPNKAKKMQDEIDNIIGRDRIPSFDDKKNMPYTEAVLNETLRLSVISAMGDPHSTLEDVHYQGYIIPKGTDVFPNLYAVLRDPKKWTNADKFIPERFLDADGKFKNNSEFLPFGLGRRSCPGESFARIQMFYFVTGLLQRFNFELVKGEPAPSLEPRVGALLLPQPFRLTVTERY